VPKADALSALMLAFVIELFTIVGFAALSTASGRRPVYIFGALPASSGPPVLSIGRHQGVDLDRGAPSSVHARW